MELILKEKSKKQVQKKEERKTSAFTDSQIDYLQSARPTFKLRKEQMMIF